MWISEKVVDWFTSMKNVAELNAAVSVEAINGLREELAAVRADRDALKLQVAISSNHFDWLRLRVNTLEAERAQLIEKAYGIRIPAPELVRTPVVGDGAESDKQFTFDDIGEDLARKLGLASYNA
jgi:hypothetical protein